MNPRLFDPHTFEVKVKVTVDTLINSNYYDHNARAICAMRSDNCHIDFVVAVWDKINDHLQTLNSTRVDLLEKLKVADMTEAALVKFLDETDNYDFHSDTFQFPEMDPDKSADLKALVIQYLNNRHCIEKVEQYKGSIDAIIATKPMMPYQQEVTNSMKPT